MKIECLIKRKGGSVIDMDAPARTYHFAPESGNHEDPHVADVLEQSHVRCLLRIREAYRVLSGEELPEEAQQQNKHEQELVDHRPASGAAQRLAAAVSRSKTTLAQDQTAQGALF